MFAVLSTETGIKMANKSEGLKKWGLGPWQVLIMMFPQIALWLPEFYYGN